jgi:hypothetical protein
MIVGPSELLQVPKPTQGVGDHFRLEVSKSRSRPFITVFEERRSRLCRQAQDGVDEMMKVERLGHVLVSFACGYKAFAVAGHGVRGGNRFFRRGSFASHKVYHAAILEYASGNRLQSP